MRFHGNGIPRFTHEEEEGQSDVRKGARSHGSTNRLTVTAQNETCWQELNW